MPAATIPIIDLMTTDNVNLMLESDLTYFWQLIHHLPHTEIKVMSMRSMPTSACNRTEGENINERSAPEKFQNYAILFFEEKKTLNSDNLGLFANRGRFLNMQICCRSGAFLTMQICSQERTMLCTLAAGKTSLFYFLDKKTSV